MCGQVQIQTNRQAASQIDKKAGSRVTVRDARTHTHVDMHLHAQTKSLTHPHIHLVGQSSHCDSARERDFARERERKENTSYTHWCTRAFTFMLHSTVPCQAFETFR